MESKGDNPSMTQMTWWLNLCVNSGRNSYQAPQLSAGVIGHAHLTWPQSSLVASAGILVYAPFDPGQIAVTPFGDWVPVDDIYGCSVPG